MKTKLSKRILSVVLAALMVVTSVPLMAISAFADVSSSDLNVSALDSYAKDLYDAMDEFEAKLHEDVIYADATTAYAKYVDAQKAFDAYVYGTADKSVAENAASQLRAAMDAMTVYTGKMTGNAVPTFADSTEDEMAPYAGEGYSNILYYPQATELGVNEVKSVRCNVVYSANPVLLYDGQTDVKMPVMMSGYLTEGKKRYVYSSYPTATTDGSADHDSFQLTGYWHNGSYTDNTIYNNGSNPDYLRKSADDSKVYGTTQDWNWQWERNTNSPSYNKATGFHALGGNSAEHRTAMLLSKIQTNTTIYVYTKGYNNYSANVLQLVKAPTADYSQEYSGLNWYFCTGQDASDDNTVTTGDATIRVINYKTLADKIAVYYNWVKGKELADYSEGGLTEYFNAMKAATSYNPNTDFANGTKDGYAACITNMQSLVDKMDEAADVVDHDVEYNEPKTDNDKYEALRGVMNKLMSAYNKGVNNGYTEDSWNGFIALWAQAQKIMNDVVDYDYTSPGLAETVAKQLSDYKLATNEVKVDTEILELVIDTYESWTNMFTADSTAALVELIEEAKSTVWPNEAGTSDSYKDAASALNDEDHNQNTVDAYAVQIVSAIKALRFSPDAVVTTSQGKYSINTAMALEEAAAGKENYSGYAEFKSALNAAAEYKDSLDNLSVQFEIVADKSGKFVVNTDYADQRSNYTAIAEKVAVTYKNLAAPLLDTENGHILKITSMDTISLNYNKNSSYKYNTDFTYPELTYVLRTTHDAAVINYGNASVEYRINIDNNIDKYLNALDSITINADPNVKSQELVSKNYMFPPYTNPSLTDAQRESVAGCLSKDIVSNGETVNFALSNFVVSNQYNNRKTRVGTAPDGTEITDFNSPLITTALATTEGQGGDDSALTGRIELQPANKGDASITLTGDISISLGATEKKPLSADTKPSTKNYMLDGYFGATTFFHTQPQAAWGGYQYMTSIPDGDYAGKLIQSAVTVIDVSYLVDLINECNALLPYSVNFTQDSWDKFISALSEANKAIDPNMAMAGVVGLCQQRYTALWNAYNALEIPLTFVAKNADGTDKTTVVNVLYNYYLDDDRNLEEFGEKTAYTAAVQNACETADSYLSADSTRRYTFKGWAPDVDMDTLLNTKVTAKQTYTAQYDESLNLADFTNFDAAKEALKTKINTPTAVYSLSALNAIKAEVEAMAYFFMSADDKGNVLATAQSDIDAETAKLTAIIDGLVPAQLTEDAAKAFAKASLDEDAYNASFAYTTTVAIDDVTVPVLTFDNQTELDAAIREAMNNGRRVYEIKVNGTVIGTAEYGEVVVADSEGNLHKGIDIDTSFPELANVAWSYRYNAPSRGDAGFTAAKYMLTATSIGFVVKGDTELTTANAKSDGEGFAVKFVADLGTQRVFLIKYTTDGTVTMPTSEELPAYAFYNFAGFANGAQLGETITVNADTTIVANYTAQTADTFTIDYFENFDAWQGEEYTQYVAEYNELIKLSNPDAYCWVISMRDYDDTWDGEHRIVAYGTDYSFYACESYEFAPSDIDGMYYGITALTYDDYENIIRESTTNTGEANPDWQDFLVDAQGNKILGIYDDYYGTITVPDLAPAVNAVKDVFEITGANGSPEKFSLIGSVAIPENYKLVETGFLVSKNEAANLKLENVGKDGVNRMKASRLIGDNQFVINIKASGDMDIKYAAYAIVEMPDGSLNTIYTLPVSGEVRF
ncbi:MAG: hypothetical protein K2L19_01230 [Eubacterium sp.]|nr:hypothetical protein [Eubacterium sp.]